MFYNKDEYLINIFTKYKDFFFCGFEWEHTINYSFVSEFNQLINQDDYERWKTYFGRIGQEQNKQAEVSPHVNEPDPYTSFLRRLARKVKRAFVIVSKMLPYKNKEENKEPLFIIHPTAQIEKKELVIIKNHAEIKDYVIIRTYENPVVIGEFTQLNPFTVVYGGSGVFIGNNVMIAPHCMIAAGNHDFIQTEKPIRFAGNLTKGPIIIEDNVWIGANCTIADGVRIGKDAVVAANSVVIHDVAPYDIVGGVPAHVIRNRKENQGLGDKVMK
jgi:acetyltransferase-like isoleucine patch superfamily enzyme